MQIITIDDQDFEILKTIIVGGKKVGTYIRSDGKAAFVCASDRFMLISNELVPTKIAIKPTRSMQESEQMALVYLRKEVARGSKVDVTEEYRVRLSR